MLGIKKAYFYIDLAYRIRYNISTNKDLIKGLLEMPSDERKTK